MKIVLLIPAYQPAPSLIASLDVLSRSLTFAGVIVVNDGSPPEFDSIFADAAEIPGVEVLRHSANLGKGAALKTGFIHARDRYQDLFGIVTADADGQHVTKDILRVAEQMREHPGLLVLGARKFEGYVPLRSRVGNRVTRAVFGLVTGDKLIDTQTGLRGVPTCLLPRLLQTRTSAYDFECDMLLEAKRIDCQIHEVVIKTVYDSHNTSSHFRPVRDSIKVYLVLLRFCLSQRRQDLGGTVAERNDTLKGNAWREPTLVAGLAVLGALAVYGLVTSQIFSQEIWYREGLHRAGRFVFLFVILSLPLLLFASAYFRAAVVVTLLTGTALAVGPRALLAVLFFFQSATVIGVSLLGNGKTDDRDITKYDDLPLALCVGAAVLISVEEVLVRTPWNYPWVYIALLFVPSLLAPRLAIQILSRGASALRPLALKSLSERAASGVLALIVAAQWLLVLKPEVSEDGLAMHLAIADEVAWKHQFLFDIAHNIWAVMPMGADWCFTLVFLLGGEFAARLLNFGFLLVLIALLYSACRRFVARGAALWVAALFAATPLVQGVTGSLMVENILAAVLFGAIAALWQFRETGRLRYAYAAALLLGTSLRVKLGAVAYVLPGSLLLGSLVWHGRKFLIVRPATIALRLALILVAAGAPPYLIAWFKTGDPIFPFANSRFDSPLLGQGVIVRDSRYLQPLKLRTPFDLTFHTQRFYEGQNGSLGIQYFLLMPVGVLLLFQRRSFVVLSATFIALFGSIVVLLSQPNARYIYESLPLFHVTIAYLLVGFEADRIAPKAMILAAFAASIGVELYLFPSSGWYHKDFYSAPLFTSRGRARYIRETAPQRMLLNYLGRQHPGEALLQIGESVLVGVRNPDYRYHWHDQATKQQLNTLAGIDDLVAFTKRQQIKHFLLPEKLVQDTSTAMQEFARACVDPDLRMGGWYLGHLNDRCAHSVPAELLHKLFANGRLYQDVDPELTYTGDWAHQLAFPWASGGTVSFSNTPGAAVQFAFEGDAVGYVYTAAPNRGIAQIAIDGELKSELDLYSKSVKWQSTALFGNLRPGKHVIEITVTGRKRHESEGCFLDVDAFAVPER